MNERRERAAKIKDLPDVKFPEMKFWNYEEGTPRRHQRVGTSWLYWAERGILADTVGLGKTIVLIALIDLLKERGQLRNSALVIVKPSLIMQWCSEIQRFSPDIGVMPIIGPERERSERYAFPGTDVFVIGFQMALRDAEIIRRVRPSLCIADDVDPIRNRDNATARLMRRIARTTDRMVVSSGTPIQTRLHELYAMLEVVDEAACVSTFGSESQFERRYIKRRLVKQTDPKTGKSMSRKVVVGYKNMEEFKRLVKPFYLRRTHHDLDDSDLPDVVTDTIWLDLTAPQREAYRELQRGVVRLIKEEGETVDRVSAFAKLSYGARICAGLGTLEGIDDVPGDSMFDVPNSCKMDWLIDNLTGDMADEKAVVFCQFKDTIRLAQRRMEEAGVGYVTIWGDERNPHLRQARQRAFWENPETRVCIGTSAMEHGLNLQVARIHINIDMLTNPARMEQLMGRIRRMGSKHKTVFVYNILSTDTQEERYMPLLEQRQALADFVFGERSDLFKPLSSLQILQLISP